MKKLEWVPHTEWPRSSNAARFNVWRSEDYLAQAYHEKDGVVRLSVTGTDDALAALTFLEQTPAPATKESVQ